MTEEETALALEILSDALDAALGATVASSWD